MIGMSENVKDVFHVVLENIYYLIDDKLLFISLYLAMSNRTSHR